MEKAKIIKDLPDALMTYMEQWRELADEYDRIPSWRFFKQMKNLRQRKKLTKDYTKKMKEWGVI